MRLKIGTRVVRRGDPGATGTVIAVGVGKVRVRWDYPVAVDQFESWVPLSAVTAMKIKNRADHESS